MAFSRTCPSCAQPFALAATGRTATYCSTRCRMAAYRARRAEASPATAAPAPELPEQMREARRWVRWVREERNGRMTKRPLTVTGHSASVTRPRAWSSLDEVRSVSHGDGIGFVLGEGIGAIDLDHCLVDGVLAPWAAAIVARAPRTYIEVSPSGDGLHIFGLLAEAPGRGQHDRDGVEFYSQGRYITVTESRWETSVDSLADLSDLVASL